MDHKSEANTTVQKSKIKIHILDNKEKYFMSLKSKLKKAKRPEIGLYKMPKLKQSEVATNEEMKPETNINCNKQCSTSIKLNYHKRV